MKIKVHMLAFEAAGVIREVTLPDNWQEEYDSLLDAVFYYGQNDWAIGPEKNTTCSVSVADVIATEDGLYFVMPCGFRQITTEQLNELRLMDQWDRQWCNFAESYGVKQG